MNEYEWAEQMISNHDLGPKPIETLSRIAKYYRANQYDCKDVRILLEKFLTQCDPYASIVRWSDTLDKIAKNSGRHKLIKIDYVPISQSELDCIQNLNGTQIKRLAFVLLCVSKYWDIVSVKNNHWVNTSDKDIMKMANITTSIRRQSAMFGELKEKGLIKFSKKIDNLNVQVLFSDQNPDVMKISDFRNLGYQYLKHYGGDYIECENCGLTVKIQHPEAHRKQKYCPSCAVEVRTRQNVNSVMRHREMLKVKANL